MLIVNRTNKSFLETTFRNYFKSSEQSSGGFEWISLSLPGQDVSRFKLKGSRPKYDIKNGAKFNITSTLCSQEYIVKHDRNRQYTDKHT